MTPANIGWLISFILWLLFAIVNIYANQQNQTELIFFSLSLEVMSLGFMWVFIGLEHGWW